jgi:putative membrane protein
MKAQMVRLSSILSIVILAACAGSMGSGPFPAQPGAMPESDVAGIVMTANEGEVQQGTAAASRATSADVRAFAQMMVSDHTNAMNTARDTFARAGVSPAENSTTASLRATSQRAITNLGTYSGAAFDRKYMQAQADMHQWLLNSLDTTLIPSAVNPEVRSLLQTQRSSVAMHLERARQILAGL